MQTYYSYTEEELQKHAMVPLKQFDSSKAVFSQLAQDMLDVICDNNKHGRKTVIICTVGPTQHYPYFVERVNSEQISLLNCWFFNMDAYVSDSGDYIDSALSFRGYMNREVYGKIEPHLCMPESQRIFPDPHAPYKVAELLASFGGADLCIAGIGMNGHIAFNEPEPGMSVESFANITVRVLQIAEVSRACCAMADLGGAIECVPNRAVTLGMRELLSAKKIRVAVFRDWHRAVLRRTVCGSVSASFPASLLQCHEDVQIYANPVAAKASV